jgi:diadenosine tetraphosphate (Ap4A) HIT family hydrolase
MRGYICLVSQIHAVELHDLSDDEAGAFARDARNASRALASVTGAVKINYEIHGNSVPHLHMHLFPRYRGDQFEGTSINPRAAIQPVYRHREFEQIRDSLVAALVSETLGN